MTVFRLCWISLATVCVAGALSTDLSRAKAEPNLEKRSKEALDNADRALKGAREAYGNGDSAKMTELIKEVEDSVVLAEESLKETGKNPRKSPKWFKRAEIQTRNLLRRLDSFRDEMSVTDRPALDGVRAKIQQVHEDLLLGVMEGKRK